MQKYPREQENLVQDDACINIHTRDIIHPSSIKQTEESTMKDKKSIKKIEKELEDASSQADTCK